MKRFLKYSMILLGLLAVAYIGGLIFFLDRFTFGSYFGDIPLMGLTQAQAKEKIAEELGKRQINLQENGKTTAQVTLAELSPSYDLDKAVGQLFNQQDPVMWPLSFGSHQDVKVDSNMVHVDKTKAAQVLVAKGIDNSKRQAATDASIEYSEADGYQVKPDVTGTQVDTDSLAQDMLVAATQEKNSVDVSQAYAKAAIQADSDTMKSALGLIKQYSENPIVLQIAGDDVQIPTKTIESWMHFDENNQVSFDREAIKAYVQELNDKYSTYNKTREFKSTLRGIVEVPPGIMGWGIEVDQEVDKLEQELLAHQPVKREPAVNSTGGVPNAKDDIGPTYVEVDISNQTMFLYKDHKKILEAPVVTGQPAAETVPGAGAIIEKLSGTRLKGYNQFYRVDYSVPVNYWMRFDDKSQGIHDAPWQSQFGGDVWTYSGSLGCVNSPLDAAATIYENVEYGTPVIVFN